MPETGDLPFFDVLLDEILSTIHRDVPSGFALVLCGLRTGPGRVVGVGRETDELAGWWKGLSPALSGPERATAVERRAGESGDLVTTLADSRGDALGWCLGAEAIPDASRRLLVAALELGHWVTGERRHFAALVEARTTELERSRHELQGVDPETGLANRRDFDRAFEREWRRAARLRRPVGLVLVEVLAGVTRPLAARLASVPARATDLVGRWDARRMVVLLPDTELEDVEGLGQRLVSAMGDQDVRVGIGGVTPRVGFLQREDLVAITLEALETALEGEPGTVITRELDDVAHMTGGEEPPVM